MSQLFIYSFPINKDTQIDWWRHIVLVATNDYIQIIFEMFSELGDQTEQINFFWFALLLETTTVIGGNYFVLKIYILLRLRWHNTFNTLAATLHH